jgi:hypothetical protein
VNALKAPLVAKNEDATISRTSPAMRDSPVAMEKIAVLRAMRRPAADGCSAGRGARESAATGALL